MISNSPYASEGMVAPKDTDPGVLQTFSWLTLRNITNAPQVDGFQAFPDSHLLCVGSLQLLATLECCSFPISPLLKLSLHPYLHNYLIHYKEQHISAHLWFPRAKT